MRAGQLRHRVNIEEKTTTKDSFGGQSDAWSNLTASGWRVAIMPDKGNESDPGERQEAHGRFQIRLRYYSGLSSQKHRFKEPSSGRVFHMIEPPRNYDERNCEMVVRCIEVSNG